MPGRLLFSKDAGERCNETMTLSAEGTIIESNLMYREFHPNFDPAERNGIGNWGDETLGAMGLDSLALPTVTIYIGGC